MARPAATVDRLRGNIAVGAVIEPNDRFATVLTVNVTIFMVPARQRPSGSGTGRHAIHETIQKPMLHCKNLMLQRSKTG